MTIQIGKKMKDTKPKNIWRVNVQTMTNDADGWNDFNLDFSDKSEFEKVILYCDVMKKQYNHGRGGGSCFYDHLDFFDKYFNEEWYYEYGEYMDSWDGFSLTYFDQTGEEFDVTYNLSSEDKEIIASYEVKQ